MDSAQIERLRLMLDAAILQQLPPKEQEMARGIAGVILGIAFDIGRIASALEGIEMNTRGGT